MEVKEELKAVGRRAASIRYMKGLQQYKAAELIGVNQGHLSNMEHGRANITLVNLLKMRQLYDCKMADFFMDEEEKPKPSDLELIVAVAEVFGKKIRR